MSCPSLVPNIHPSLAFHFHRLPSCKAQLDFLLPLFFLVKIATPWDKHILDDGLSTTAFTYAIPIQIHDTCLNLECACVSCHFPIKLYTWLMALSWFAVPGHPAIEAYLSILGVGVD